VALVTGSKQVLARLERLLTDYDLVQLFHFTIIHAMRQAQISERTALT
jgi:hypothetical protein